MLVSDDGLDKLAAWVLNGRDIKHAVNNTTKWCYIKKAPVNRQAHEVGINVTTPSAVMEGTDRDHDYSEASGSGVEQPPAKRRRL